MEERNTPRIYGALEALFGTGLVALTALIPEVRESAISIPLYFVGGGAVIDGTADAITGRYFYLIERAVILTENIKYRREQKEAKVGGKK